MGAAGEDERRLLEVEPLDIEIPFELRKQISCSIQLTNMSEECVAFKIKTTNPKKYCVKPSNGIVLPRSLSTVVVTMQAQLEAPPDMQCKDKFLVQSVVTSPRASPKDITQEMFTKESGNFISEVKLRVSYVSPPQPPSPVPEETEEVMSPPRAVETKANRMDTKEPEMDVKLIKSLMEERDAVIQQSDKLRREIEVLRRQSATVKKPTRGFSTVHVVLVILLGILFGYFLKR